VLCCNNNNNKITNNSEDVTIMCDSDDEKEVKRRLKDLYGDSEDSSSHLRYFGSYHSAEVDDYDDDENHDDDEEDEEDEEERDEEDEEIKDDHSHTTHWQCHKPSHTGTQGTFSAQSRLQLQTCHQCESTMKSCKTDEQKYQDAFYIDLRAFAVSTRTIIYDL
jgi:hypothetical protein